jgi:two-component system chemotaxis response regulator CheY
MPKRVLDIGNCNPDHAAIRGLIQSNFDAEVVRAHGWRDASAELQPGRIDLVLVNRRLDRDHSDGLEIIRQIKSDERLAAVPCMLISNFADFQARAIEIGAEPGFGKAELDEPATVEKLQRFLG